MNWYTADFKYYDKCPTKNRKNNKPECLIHGHVHEKWKTNVDNMINVGVGVWDYSPVFLKKIKTLVK